MWSFIKSFRNALRDWREGVNPPVFLAAAFFTWGVILFGAIWTETAGAVFDFLLDFIAIHFGWYYVITMSGVVIFVFWLLLGPYGKVRLGSDRTRPDFGYTAWFSMLFAAGMGMGLVFWGVAEPLFHLIPPNSRG